MEFAAKARVWGNSLGITFPKEIVKATNISQGTEVVVSIKKKHSMDALRALQGKFTFNATTQAMKDEMRKGWE